MAYDEQLAERVRACLGKRRVITKKMMGSLAFMVNGWMACAVGADGLLVRVVPDTRDAVLALAHVEPMRMRGRTMQGFVRVATKALRTDAALAKWVQRGVEAGAAQKKAAPARVPKTIDAYLQGVPEDKRAALEDLRRKIHRVVPQAEECISYRIPAFRWRGDIVGGFRVTAKGCSYYPFSGSTLKALAPFVKAYEQTKSALHFDPAAPLPLALVRRLVRQRCSEIEAQGG